MNAEEFIVSFKEQYGDQRTREGVSIRDMDDRELLKRVIQRYPGEKKNIYDYEEYVGERAPDVPDSPVKKRLDDMLLNNPVTRGIQSVFPGKKIGESLGTIAAAGGRAIQGDLKGAGEILDTQVPIPQLAGDIVAGGATALSAGLAAPASLAGKVGLGAGLGGTISGGRALSEGKDVGDIAKATAFGGAVGGAIPLATEAIKGVGKLFKGAGDKIQISVIKPTSADIKDGFSMDTIKKYDLGGSLTHSFQKTEQVMDDLTAQLNSRIEKGSPVNLQDVFKETTDDLLKNRPGSFGSQGNIESALNQLKGEVDGVGGTVDLPDAQIIKRAAGHMGAWQFGMRDPESTAREKVYNVFYTKIKEAIENSSPEGVKEINKQISELIPVMNALIRRIPIAQRSNALSLQDVISLSASAVDPKALGVGLLNFASKSGAFGNLLSKAGEQVQKGLPEIVGNTARTFIPQATVPRD